MPKHLAALLSIFGLASSVVPAEAQVLKGSQPAPNEKTKATQTVAPADKSKQLKLNQQTVRELSGKKANANQAVGQNTGTCRYSEGCQTQNKAATPPPAQKLTLKQENLRNATDKSAGQLTKGNQQITKGNQAITKDNQQITKGNQALTKGNQQITKGNQQITKGNQQQLTKGNQQLTPPPPQNR